MTKRCSALLWQCAMAIGLVSSLPGCVGVVVVGESRETYDARPFAIGRSVGQYPDYSRKDGQQSPPLAWNRKDVLALWGEPIRKSGSGSTERWFYRRELGWSGVIPAIGIPIPLLVPIGYRETILDFEGESLLRITKLVGGERGGLCGLVVQHVPQFGCFSFR